MTTCDSHRICECVNRSTASSCVCAPCRMGSYMHLLMSHWSTSLINILHQRTIVVFIVGSRALVTPDAIIIRIDTAQQQTHFFMSVHSCTLDGEAVVSERIHPWIR